MWFGIYRISSLLVYDYVVRVGLCWLFRLVILVLLFLLLGDCWFADLFAVVFVFWTLLSLYFSAYALVASIWFKCGLRVVCG